MLLINKYYIRLYLVVLMLYAFFNKGIAYSYLAELLLFSGAFLLFLNRKRVEFLMNKQYYIILFFILISGIYIFSSALQFPIIDVIRDSLCFQYAWFVLIIFFFKEESAFIWESIRKIYLWVPLVLLLNFILFNYLFINLPSLNLFGPIHILIYKNGDKGVHLFISTILLILFSEKYSSKLLFINTILIALNLLIVLAYSRSGTLAYLVSIISFFLFNKRSVHNENLKKIIQFAPIILTIAIGVFLTIRIQEDMQGRVAGFSQIKDNLTSIVSSDIDGSLGDNKVWRYVWWLKIINESLQFKHIFIGKGLGMSLAGSDQLADGETVRSPHNFHLTILARFGYFVFIVWLYWLIGLFKPLFTKKLEGKSIAIVCILLSFIINGSFDVFFEGPMGAFPFWTFVGLFFVEVYFYNPKEIPN